MNTTTKTVKPVNYTPEMTSALVEAYKANPTKETVATFATKFGKTTKSVVAKLSREGVYVKATPTAKDGTPVAKKDTLVETIATAMNVPSEQLDGLEKAPKNVLKLILAAMA
jgi:hypothetical protein